MTTQNDNDDNDDDNSDDVHDNDDRGKGAWAYRGWYQSNYATKGFF